MVALKMRRLVSLIMVASVLTGVLAPQARAEVPCGIWTAVGNQEDERLLPESPEESSNSACQTTLELRSDAPLGILFGTSYFGGYTLEAQPPEVQNASITLDPMASNSDHIEYVFPMVQQTLSVTPSETTSRSKVVISAKMTPHSFSIDTGVYLLKAVIAGRHLPTDCAMSENQVALLAIKLSPILMPVAESALAPNGTEEINKFQTIAGQFLTAVVKNVPDENIRPGCIAREASNFLLEPPKMDDLAVSYESWLVMVQRDYLKYQDRPVALSVIYDPPPQQSRVTNALAVFPAEMKEYPVASYQMSESEAIKIATRFSFSSRPTIYDDISGANLSWQYKGILGESSLFVKLSSGTIRYSNQFSQNRVDVDGRAVTRVDSIASAVQIATAFLQDKGLNQPDIAADPADAVLLSSGLEPGQVQVFGDATFIEVNFRRTLDNRPLFGPEIFILVDKYAMVIKLEYFYPKFLPEGAVRPIMTLNEVRASLKTGSATVIAFGDFGRMGPLPTMSELTDMDLQEVRLAYTHDYQKKLVLPAFVFKGQATWRTLNHISKAEILEKGKVMILAPAARNNSVPSRYVVLMDGINSHQNSNEDGPEVTADFTDIQQVMTRNIVYFSYNAAIKEAFGGQYCQGWFGSGCTESGDLTSLALLPNYSTADTHKHINLQVSGLNWLLNQIVRKDPSSEIYIVGFSLGGVVAARWAAVFGDDTGTPSHVRTILLLESPVGGLPTANACIYDRLKWGVCDWSNKLFGREVQEDLQVPIDPASSKRGIVSSLSGSADHYPIVAIQSTRDYAVNGESFPLVYGNTPVGYGIQKWPNQNLTRRIDWNLGGTLAVAPLFGILPWDANKIILNNHGLPLHNSCVVKWIKEVITGKSLSDSCQ